MCSTGLIPRVLRWGRRDGGGGPHRWNGYSMATSWLVGTPAPSRTGRGRLRRPGLGWSGPGGLRFLRRFHYHPRRFITVQGQVRSQRANGEG